MILKKLSLGLVSCMILWSCSDHDTNQNNKNTDSTKTEKLVPLSGNEDQVNGIPTAVITELTDEQYPDNPDIEIRHALNGQFSHSRVEVIEKNGRYTFVFYPNNDKSDTISVKNIDIMEYMPSAPEWIKDNEYLTYIGIVNQEWNRQQVQYTGDEFLISGNGIEKNNIVRVDIARNCLNAYLWEIIAYANNADGEQAPCYHGWFNFPRGLYSTKFKERNNLDYEKYRPALEEWIDPASKAIDYSQLRSVIKEKDIVFSSHNNELYPLLGARKTKRKNIVYPEKIKQIDDMLTDSTLYSTFSIPGYYNTKTPRKTELSRFGLCESIKTRKIISANGKNDTLIEIDLLFAAPKEHPNQKMHFVIGGINTKSIDTLTLDTHHKAYKMPMGIANHSFYESKTKMEENSTKTNPYYAFLTDQDLKWLDSHTVGIDGPMLWFDQNGVLHLMILSFERHAFVGHYKLYL